MSEEKITVDKTWLNNTIKELLTHKKTVLEGFSYFYMELPEMDATAIVISFKAHTDDLMDYTAELERCIGIIAGTWKGDNGNEG